MQKIGREKIKNPLASGLFGTHFHTGSICLCYVSEQRQIRAEHLNTWIMWPPAQQLPKKSLFLIFKKLQSRCFTIGIDTFSEHNDPIIQKIKICLAFTGYLEQKWQEISRHCAAVYKVVFGLLVPYLPGWEALRSASLLQRWPAHALWPKGWQGRGQRTEGEGVWCKRSLLLLQLLLRLVMMVVVGMRMMVTTTIRLCRTDPQQGGQLKKIKLSL